MDGNIAHCILELIEKEVCILSIELAKRFQYPHQKVVGAIKSLESLGDVVKVKQILKKSWVCSEEGEKLARDGSHEARLFYFMPEDGELIINIKNNFPDSNVALGAALKNKWLKKDGDKVYRCEDNIIDDVQRDLQIILEGSSSSIDDRKKAEYKKRKLIKEVDLTIFEVRKGKSFTTSVSKQEAELTKDMIESGQWRTKTFKPFNFKAKGKSELRPGYLHPLMQLRGEFRHIFLEMGFTEMPTNNYIESAFWNFDALFQPQQHPARDAQDTFYVANPERTISVPMDYLEKVKTVHSVGGYGSVGYRSSWSFNESQKNLLRTHTTAVSARLLCKLAQEGFQPVKYFSIDKVYRNETLDATHLAEFHQVEGVIADYDLSMKHLMGTFAAFFEKIGIKNIRFKPTYNPYTEPSMEIYSFHKGLNKWVEVGNSGYFRPEMLRPMGLPKNVTVAGWGLSLERPAMIMYGINNIRELVGSKVRLELIHENSICTIDKFGRKERKLLQNSGSYSVEHLSRLQTGLLKKLEDLQKNAATLVMNQGLNLQCDYRAKFKGNHDDLPSRVVISADPDRLPYSLYSLMSALSELVPVSVSIHTHSSIEADKLLYRNLKLWSYLKNNLAEDHIKTKIVIVWKSDGDTALHPTMSVNPLTAVQVTGEANIARYLSRLIDSRKNPSTSPLYEERRDPALVETIDQILDKCHENISYGLCKKKIMNFIRPFEKYLEKSSFLCGNSVSVADLVLLSILRQMDVVKNSSSHIQKWIEKCSEDPVASLVLLNFLDGYAK